MKARFDGTVALVTGAAAGIGEATARRLYDEGARVALLDRDKPRRRRGPRVLPLVADVADASSVERALGEIATHFGGLDVLVNNAGIGAVGTVEETGDEEWKRVFDVNVFGMARASRAALPLLRKSRTPAIVNVCSIVGTTGLRNRACYGASKGAVLALTLAMAADYVAEGIRVNCVTPGTVDTPWVGRLLAQAGDPKRERAALEARQPMGRLGTAEEIADAIAFLAAPTSRFITGTVLAIDGGMAGVRV